MCGCGQNGKGGWLRTSRLGVRISPPAPDLESWVSGLNHLTANEAHRKVPRVQISHSPPDLEEVSHGGTLVLKTSQCQRSWHKRVRLLSLPPFCKRRREGMAPVRKTEALRSQWVRSPPLAPVGSHDLVAMMSACHAERESSILSGTPILVIDK